MRDKAKVSKLGHTLRKNGRAYAFCYAMVAFAVIQFAVFYVWININSIVMAFQQYTGNAADGTELYQWSFFQFDRLFREFSLPASQIAVAIRNTFLYFGAGVALVFICFFFSYFLYKKVWGYRFFRIIFYLPSIINAVVWVTVYRDLIQKYGPIYELLESWFGYELPALLSNVATATPTIIAFTVWTGLGVNMILYLGAMNRLPQEVIEAGELDGISWWREMFSIVLPMIWPTVSTTLILQCTQLFNSSGPILLFGTAGIPAGSYDTTTISYWIFSATQAGNDLNFPAAMGLFFTLISFPIVLFIRWFFNKIDPDVEY